MQRANDEVTERGQQLASDPRITFTVFESKDRPAGSRKTVAWSTLVSWLTKLSPSPDKDGLLIKLATFKDNYKIDANVETIYGVEGDHDAETMHPQEAARLLTQAGILAVVVTTHSHEPDKPRWRVYAPLSVPGAYDDRHRLVAKLNGVLGGVLAKESFTAAQAFYVTHRPDSEYRVIECRGQPIDLVEVTAEPVGPPAKSQGADAPPQDDLKAPSLDVLVAAVQQLAEHIADADRDTWIGFFGHAIKAAGADWLDEARDLFLGASSGDPDENARAYDTLDGPHRVGWPDLVKAMGGQGAPLEFEADPSATPTPAELPGDKSSSNSLFVDLGPYLDGTVEAPEADMGGERSDGRLLLGSGRWHTLGAPTGAGKSFWMLWQAKAVLEAGGAVIYLHFEEHGPGGTVSRLRKLGVPDDDIRQRFYWLDCSVQLTEQRVREHYNTAKPRLVLLDGINAACSNHGQDVEKVSTVGWYRRTFVTPAATLGAAIISAGHPVKSRERQSERHIFGSSAWLDDVDGVAYRLEADAHHPIEKFKTGWSHLSIVKDRYSLVSPYAAPSKREGWKYLGPFVVSDDQTSSTTEAGVIAPENNSADAAPVSRDSIDILATAIIANVQSFDNKRDLHSQLRVARVKFSNDDLGPALLQLERKGQLVRAEKGISGKIVPPAEPNDFDDVDSLTTNVDTLNRDFDAAKERHNQPTGQ